MRVIVLFLVISISCGPPVQKPKAIIEPKHITLASVEAHLFVNWWVAQHPENIGLTNKLRNKLLYEADREELEKYFESIQKDVAVFGNFSDSVKALQYREINPKLIYHPVQWIDHDHLRGCRALSYEAMWDCLQSDYLRSDYYYLGVPIFSADRNWVVLNVSYMNKNNNKSYGGGRLFQKLSNGRWKQAAILALWGNLPN